MKPIRERFPSDSAAASLRPSLAFLASEPNVSIEAARAAKNRADSA
jgi:hypothetical protein